MSPSPTFPCEFSDHFQNSLSTKHLWTAASLVTIHLCPNLKKDMWRRLFLSKLQRIIGKKITVMELQKYHKATLKC